MAGHAATDAEMIFGRMLCDRLGLQANEVAREFTVEPLGTSKVHVALTVNRFMDAEEFNTLRLQAHERARLADG
jgi:hypothetical protein